MSNRVIKFRAWNTRTNTMIYTNSDNTVWVGGIAPSVNIAGLGEQVPGDYIPMQLTGVKDKNNISIYEGDICWTYEIGLGNLKRVVVFDSGSFCLKHDFALTSELRGWKTDYIEVIGNIHQNPELL